MIRRCHDDSRCATNGFGLYPVGLESAGEEIGRCGPVNRETPGDVDIGFAFLPRFWGQGYGVESATAVIASERRAFGLDRFFALISPDNLASIQVLKNIAMRFERRVELSKDEPEINSAEKF